MSSPGRAEPVAVIGAGITGLSAAYALQEAGVPVVVFEATHRPGGVIVSHRDGPWLAEGGPNTLLDTSHRVSELVTKLGLANRRFDSNPEADARYVVRGGKPLPLPRSVFQFLSSPLYSFRAKLRLLAEPFISRGQSDESVARFVRRRFGRELLDYSIDPLVTGTYAGDPEFLSIQHAFPRIHALEARYGSVLLGQILGARDRRRRGEISRSRAKKFSFDDGLQVLTDTLAGRVHDVLRFNATVSAVRWTRDGWILGVHENRSASGDPDADNDPPKTRCSAVLYCGTAAGLARCAIIAPGAPSLASLATIRYPPVTSVVLGFRRADVGHPCSGFGMLIPRCEGFGILGTLFSSSLFAGRAPGEHITLTTYVGGARQPENASLGDGPLVDLVLRDLGQLLGVRGQPVFRQLTRWSRAIPQFEVGYGRHRELLDELEGRAPGFFVAGHFRDGVALGDCIDAGFGAAERVRAHLVRDGRTALSSTRLVTTPSQ